MRERMPVENRSAEPLLAVLAELSAQGVRP
jgi:hypothetical protein